MAIGTVKFFNTAKGFGFIAPEGGGKDVFVHATAVEASGMRSLNEGQRVEYETVRCRVAAEAPLHHEVRRGLRRVAQEPHRLPVTGPISAAGRQFISSGRKGEGGNP